MKKNNKWILKSLKSIPINKLDRITQDNPKPPLKKSELKKFHGTNERISIDSFMKMIEFYYEMLST